MECYITDSARRFEKVRLKRSLSLGTPEMQLVKAYPDITYQSIIGFGGALTESSAYVYAQMDKETQERLLELYFGISGNRYSFCRTVIQSSDFSLAPRAYVDDPKDEELDSFSIEKDRIYEIPFIKAAISVNPKLEFIASPWSPPAWAKNNGKMIYGGRLKRGKYAVWAKMIARYLLAYRNEGIRIGRVTVQNEVQARQVWESCLYKADQEARFVNKYLRPALDEAGLNDVKILIWDHNKEGVLDRAQACIDSGGGVHIDGVAFHWYSGDHFEALAATRDLIGPEKELVFSEGCDFYSAQDPFWELSHAEHYAHEIIGDLNAGANGILDWNVLLDASGGPNHASNYCDAPIMYDADKGLNVRLPYYYLGHFSRFIAPGSKRILVTKYSDLIEVTGFLVNDKNLVIIILNRSDNEVPFKLHVLTHHFGIPVVTNVNSPKHSIMTIKY